ncbi:hypothetical protein F5Y13DRAFT_197291 [Hypoxylon sp. FL1857]|nr:hypothetical protein F5Y13DRAFT_197291 [Hypoxylon sp. FL1857]
MSSASLSLYNSLPLSIERKSIRVLDLDEETPGFLVATIQGHMRVVDLVDKPIFTALSYVWGSYCSPPHSICCDEVSIQITPNCMAALNALRRRFGPITIWREKETQIPLMGDIYSPHSDLAIGYLSSAGFQNYFTSTGDLYYISQRSKWVYWEIAWFLFVRRYKELVMNWWKYGFLSCVETFLSSFRGPPDKLIHRDGLRDLFSRQWAYRVWTFQEVILAKSPVIICGHSILEWRSIVYGIAYLEFVSQSYGVALPQANFNVWRNIILLWLLINSEGRTQDHLRDNALTNDITLQKFMPEYWGFLEAITRRHRRLAFVGLGVHVGLWLIVLIFIQFALEIDTLKSELAGVIVVLFAFASIGVSVVDPVFRWPVGFRETIERSTDVPNSILHEICARQATNPRDKVYGMYAIFSRLNIPLSPPEYSRTPEDVHGEAFLTLLRWTGSLGLLLCSSDRKSNYESSWVPDWGNDLTQGWFEASYLFRKGRHDATPMSRSVWSLQGDKQLVLKGAIVSSIIEHTDPFQIIDDEAVHLRFEQPLFLNSLRALKSYCQPGNPMLTRFSRPDPGDPNASDSELMLDMTTINMPYWLEILNSLAHNDRVLFRTSIPGHDTVGNCPKSSQIGDLIGLASGLPLPLVLRPEGDAYQFIGLAEVDGLMEGEVWMKFTDEDLVDIVLV